MRTLRNLVGNRDRPPIPSQKDETRTRPPEIGAERAEEKEYEEAKKKDAVAERYRTKIDKY